MEREALPPVAVVWVRGKGGRVRLGSVTVSRPCHLDVVDDLARLCLLAERLGWSIHLDEVRPDLQELMELAGIEEVLCGHRTGPTGRTTPRR